MGGILIVLALSITVVAVFGFACFIGQVINKFTNLD
tara:strand:+ start:5808 stop:5915 length:108 start_codon:yes stop_codon:yes gene_type:complete